MKLLSAALLALLLAAAAGGGEPPGAPEKKGDEKAAKPARPPAGGQAAKGVELSVANCLIIALRNNIDLRRQELADQQAELDRVSALAEFLPTLTASGERSRTEDTGGPETYARSGSVGLSGSTPWGTSLSGSASQSRDRSGGATNASSTVRAELRQPLLAGAGRAAAYYGYRSARRERLASRDDLARQAQRTVFNVRQFYWTALKNDLVVQANRRSLASADLFLKGTQARLKAGQASKLDVSNAEIQRSSREVALTSAEANLEGSLDTLKEAMALSLWARLVLTSPPVYRPAARDDARLLKQTLTRRPDLCAARQRLEVRRLDLARKRRNSWPDLDLVAGYTLTGSGDSTDESHDYDSRKASIGVELSVPLGMVRRRNELRRADLELRREKLSMRRKELSAERELRSVLRDLTAAERNLASFGKRVAAARLAAAAARALYERGKASSFDVVRAEDDLLNAELGLARSRADCLTLQAELDLVSARPVRELVGGAAPKKGRTKGR